MKNVDRAGIFRARILNWGVRPSEAEGSEALGVNMEFLITGCLAPNREWEDWTEYEEHRVFGTFYVIQRDGSVNVSITEQLARAIGWDGDLWLFIDPPAGDLSVQITVKENPDAAENRPRFGVSWINHIDYSPARRYADPGDVKKIMAKYGVQLRAAAAQAKMRDLTAGSKQRAVASAVNAASPAAAREDDVPF